MNYDREPEYRGNEALWWVLFWIVLAVLVCGFGFVKSARAATYWVAPTARGGGSGRPDSSQATTLAWFNTNAVAGDEARMLPGTYSSQIAPANSGSGYKSRITYRGADLANPGVTTVAGLVLSSRAHISVKGVSWAAAPSLGGRNDSVAYCRQTAGVWATSRADSDNVWQTFTYTGPHVEFAGGNIYSDPAEMCYRDTLRDCSWAISYNYNSSQAALRWAAIHAWVIERNRFTVVEQDGASHGIFKIYKMRSSKVTDSSFDLSSTRSNTTGCDECAWTYFRDSTGFNLWTRDTLAWGSFTATTPAVMLSATGTQAHSVRSNRYDQCVFRFSPTSSSYGHFLYYYDTADADSFTNCVVVSNGVTPLAMSRENSGNAFRGNLYLSHNTFVRIDAGNLLSVNTDFDQTLTLDKNIFYVGGTSATRTSRMAYQTTTTLQSHITGDYNVFYNANGDSAVYSSTDEQYRGPVGMCSTFTDECHSKLTNPALTGGATVATFDAHLTAGSPALFSADGYVGAYNYGSTTHTITASAGSYGSISPSGAVSVADAGSKSFTITPNAGCSISDVTVDGASVGAVGSYTFTNVTADHTIAATFSVNTYNLYSQAYTHGSISPSGTTTVSYGASQTFTITPDATYSVLDVVVDGFSVGAVTSYTFNAIAAAHSIDAYFALTANYTITSSAGSGGSISPSGATSIASGGSQAYTITPSSGYHVASVLVDGASVGAVSSYTFTNVTAAHTISVTFARDAASIMFLTDGNGSIYPGGTRSQAGGLTTYVTVVPELTRSVTALYVNGVNMGPLTRYELSAPGNVTVYATFGPLGAVGGSARGVRR